MSDTIKVVCISDTHNQLSDIEYGDILIHGGDFTNWGTYNETKDFILKMNQYPHKYKLFILGNHDNRKYTYEIIKQYRYPNLYFLDNNGIELYGYKFYGTKGLQISPMFIPEDTDILITHSPPYSILDLTYTNKQVGRQWLLDYVTNHPPLIHIFGHIHESHGILSQNNTLFINASICNRHGLSENKPISFLLPI